MRSLCIPIAASLLISGATIGGEPALEEVLVTGVQPGPALWRASSGNHDLWILGEVSPLPRKIKWRSKQFESLLAKAGEVILHDAAHYTRGRQAAQLADARELPGSVSLQAIVSPELHARIVNVAKIYGVSESLETLSPAEIGNRFANASLKTLKLQAVPLQVSVEALARKANVKVSPFHVPPPEIEFEGQIRLVKEGAVAVCPLEQVVRVLEDGGSGLRRLANAWATGDVDSLRRLMPEYGIFTEGNRAFDCRAADPDEQKRTTEYREKRTSAWLAEADRALGENQTTLAVVPIPELFAPDGYLAALRDRGYSVVEPE
jgi:hypothetical protein